MEPARVETTGQLQIDEDGYASKARRQKTAEDVMHYSADFPSHSCWLVYLPDVTSSSL